MARLAIAILLACTASAHASPGVSVELGVGTGEQWAELSGWVRDDTLAKVRFGVDVGDYVALTLGITQDLDRVETAVALGARIRPWRGTCWCTRFSPYFRGEVALVGASHLGSNYDLLAGVGHWGNFAARTPWLHWYAELDTVMRVGEYTAFTLRGELGLAFTTSSF